MESDVRLAATIVNDLICPCWMNGQAFINDVLTSAS